MTSIAPPPFWPTSVGRLPKAIVQKGGGVVIIDYGMGNLRSVQKAFETCGTHPAITQSAREIAQAGKVVLPGVGAFGAAMKNLKNLGLVAAIKDKIESGAPYLGLCLGLQLLFERSEESAGVAGLGIVPGVVRRFRTKLKVPHMGWNTISIRKKNCPLFKGIKNGEYFYFVHSYYATGNRDLELARTPYGVNFTSAIWKDNIFATQFHPEKSQSAGLRIIRNFVEYDSHTGD